MVLRPLLYTSMSSLRLQSYMYNAWRGQATLITSYVGLQRVTRPALRSISQRHAAVAAVAQSSLPVRLRRARPLLVPELGRPSPPSLYVVDSSPRGAYRPHGERREVRPALGVEAEAAELPAAVDAVQRLHGAVLDAPGEADEAALLVRAAALVEAPAGEEARAAAGRSHVRGDGGLVA